MENTTILSVKNEDVDPLYVNTINFGAGAYDLTLLMGYLDLDNTIEVKSKIILAWPHVKKLHELLGMHIEQYERMWGPVNTEPNQDVMNEMIEKGEIQVKTVANLEDGR